MFGGSDSFRDPLVIEVDEFIAVKSYKARGKRLTTFTLDEIIELEPTRLPILPEPLEEESPENEEYEERVTPTLFDNNDEE